MEIKTYENPTIRGHRVGQCVTGEGWGALTPSRCDKDAQRVVANRFCADHHEGGIATDWLVQRGKGRRHSVWMYERGTLPERGRWIRELAIDEFARIRCEFPIAMSEAP